MIRLENSRLVVFESSGKHTCMIQHSSHFVTLMYLHYKCNVFTFTNASKDAEAEIANL